ncbi:unnamed protein product [Caenorhabditis angaria]|uniref:Large ribosomal subunit protein uL3m n=1 Tax=Caenorhabditis angaria TaxID=860376 RepID=A0A9P1IIE3_9PELO|nr:unnamed protein product [Caenorhabditis angaria]
MLRSLVTGISSSPAPEWAANRLLVATCISNTQQRGRRRTLTPVPWLPPINEPAHSNSVPLNDTTKKLLEKVIEREGTRFGEELDNSKAAITDIGESTRRVGLVVRKIGMLPQWTTNGTRILCTVLEVVENNVVSVTSPEDWYKMSAIGKRKAFNRNGPMWKVTVGSINDDPTKYSVGYRRQFNRAGIPIKQKLGCFLVTEDALPQTGQSLDARHFVVGQYITATGKTIDWGFQGGMHRWGMRGQPTRRTTKSHRRIGSVGSVGDARIWPGKRMPGHMGYEWVTVSGLEVIRINNDKQVIYVKGSVPGDIGETILLKDCVQEEKKLKKGPLPTWIPSLETISEESEEEAAAEGTIPKELLHNETFSPKIFRFTSPSIVFTDADAKRAAGRDKTKAKIAKVKK